MVIYHIYFSWYNLVCVFSQTTTWEVCSRFPLEDRSLYQGGVVIHSHSDFSIEGFLSCPDFDNFWNIPNSSMLLGFNLW